LVFFFFFFFFQAEDGIRDFHVTGVQTCALPILTEVAAAVTTDAGRDEHTVAPSKLLRAEDTERALSAIELAYAEALARATERAGAWQEPETTRTDPLPALLSDLTADCRRRRQLGVELERANRTRATRVHATQSRNDRPVAHGIIRVDRGRPDAGVDMGDILGIVHVHSAGTADGQPRQRPPVGIRARDQAVRRLEALECEAILVREREVAAPYRVIHGGPEQPGADESERVVVVSATRQVGPVVADLHRGVEVLSNARIEVGAHVDAVNLVALVDAVLLVYAPRQEVLH